MFSDLRMMRQIGSLVIGKHVGVHRGTFKQLQAPAVLVITNEGECPSSQVIEEDSTISITQCECIESEGGLLCMTGGKTVTVDILVQECLFNSMAGPVITSVQIFSSWIFNSLVIKGCCFSSSTGSYGGAFIGRTGSISVCASGTIVVEATAMYECTGLSILSYESDGIMIMDVTRSNISMNELDAGFGFLPAVTGSVIVGSTADMTITGCWLGKNGGGNGIVVSFHRINLEVCESIFIFEEDMSVIVLGASCNSVTITENIFDTPNANCRPIIVQNMQGTTTVTGNLFKRYTGSDVIISYSSDSGSDTFGDSNTRTSDLTVTSFFSMNAYLYDNYDKYCPIYRLPATETFTASAGFTPTQSGWPDPTTPAPTETEPGMDIVFVAATSIGTAVGTFGIAILVFFIVGSCCVYDGRNYLKVDA